MADAKIPQTHRAILFERFSDQSDISAPNLFDFLDVYKDEELNKEIEDKLEIKSFDEFIAKFPLSVFEYIVSSANGGLPRIQYTTNADLAKKYPDSREIKLTEHGYFEMLFDMYSKKSTSGLANIEFNDAKIREILTPKREIEKLYDLRRQIPILMERKEVLQKKNENPISIDKKLKEIRRHVIEQSKNPTALLAVKLADTKQKIEMIDSSLKALGAPSEDEDEKVRLISGSIGFDADGKLLLIEAKTSDVNSTESTDSETEPQQKYLQLMSARIDKDITKYSAEMNEPTKALVISAYTGIDTNLSTPISKMDRTELVEYRDTLLDSKAEIELMFKQTEETFVKVLSDLVQKVLCVKIFFDHATVKGSLQGAGLIVTNCKANKLLQSAVKDKFVDLMQVLGATSTDKKLWFAILPQVVNGDDVFSFDDDYDDDDLEIDTAEDEVKVTNKDFVDFNDAKELLKIMDDCKITTIFNFKPSQDTTFSDITAEKIDSLKQDLKSVGYEHAVYALPNFTIMKAGSVPVSDEIGAEKIPVPAVYIDASYIAAGLLIAAQQNDFWSAKGFKNEVTILNNNPCVRIDLEGNDAALNALLTKFNCERSIDWSKDVEDAFNKDSFGFAFTGGRVYNPQSKEFIANSYIRNARTLKIIDGEYQPIFATLTKDFMATYLRTYIINDDAIKDFEKVIGEWKRQNDKFADKKIINFVLKDGEDVTYFAEDKKFDIHLKSGEKIFEVSFDVNLN